MALDLLAKVKTFEIKHKPSVKLQLRMGVHCGQVVCGLVGSKIPHYSVLGDTVEIAGLMESTGMPMMIQALLYIFFLVPCVYLGVGGSYIYKLIIC